MNKVKKLGLVGAIFLIVSSLAGSGVIALPQQLAHTGSITLISFILVTIGALFLTLVYVRAGTMFDDPSPTGSCYICESCSGSKKRTVLCVWKSDIKHLNTYCRVGVFGNVYSWS